MADRFAGKVFGNVLLKRKLGQGGMGIVYLGEHEKLRRKVAVKMMSTIQDDDKLHFQQRFLREGQTAAAVRDENVVGVLDSGIHQGTAYLVMEYVDGPSLGDVLEQKGRLSPNVVRKLGIGIAKGLSAIHAQGIVHRDIKPDNLLITSDGVAKITDLGLARQMNDPELNRLTLTGMVVGTPLYVAPEAIQDNKKAAQACDIYSLGATLYHFLAGEPPFNGATPFDVMRAHLESSPRDLAELCPECPRNMASIIRLCLNKKPEERPRLEELIAVFQSDHQVRTASTGTQIVLASIVALMVIAAAVIGWNLLQRPVDEAHINAASAHLNLTSPVAGTEIMLNGGEWMPLSSDALVLQAGHYNIAARGHSNGKALTWYHEMDLRGGSSEQINIQLQATPVRLRMQVPGTGMLFLQGEAIGTDASLTFNHAGLYAIARWDGAYAHSAHIEVKADESPPVVTWEKSSYPMADAYWRQSIQGRACLPHHVVCWLEMEWVRSSLQLDPPANWDEGELLPHLPAQVVTMHMVMALRDNRRAMRMRLPTISEAQKLSDLYKAAVWYDEDGRISTLRASGNNLTLLMLVPDR